MMKHYFLIGAIMASVAWITGCQQGFVYEQTQQVTPAGWAYTDSLRFDFTVDDTTRLYDLYLRLAVADTFPNQNVYLRLSTRFPDGRFQQMNRSFELFDTKGLPLGAKKGGSYQYDMMLQEHAFFNKTGQYQIAVAQYSRSEVLQGIQSVGVALKKLEEGR
jgi:gliding motility-associated lipoprotein GldH